MEPSEAKELIEEAIEETERADHAERALEKKFRDRVSVLVGLLAVLLAIIHVEAASSARESVLKTVEASDTYAYMEAKVIRETVVKTAAANPSLDSKGRADMLKEATRLRNPDAAGHGIVQLQAKADDLRKDGELSSKKGEWYELAETAMQVAIVLLSIALVARSAAIVGGAVALAAIGVVLALLTATGAIV
jgi:hypothetical protein